jgi:PEP-CTERM motif
LGRARLRLPGLWAFREVVAGLMKKFVVLIGILLTAVSSYASLIPGQDYTNPIGVTLLSFSGGQWQNGYPYTLGITGVTGPIDAMCDDYIHGGSIGESWQANVTILGNNDVTLTRFASQSNALGLALYREAGWILLQTPITPPDQFTDMNIAVWHIFDPAVPLDQGAQVWLDAAMAEAALGYPGVPFNDVFILTPVDQHDPNPNGPQEFLTIDPKLSGVPEPGTLVLLGTGLVGLWKRKLLS